MHVFVFVYVHGYVFYIQSSGGRGKQSRGKVTGTQHAHRWSSGRSRRHFQPVRNDDADDDNNDEMEVDLGEGDYNYSGSAYGNQRSNGHAPYPQQSGGLGQMFAFGGGSRNGLHGPDDQEDEGSLREIEMEDINPFLSSSR